MIKKIKTLLKNDYIFSVVQKGINILTSVVTVSLINRYLGVSLRGEYEYIINIVNILAIVLGLGFYESYAYAKRNKMERQLNTYLNLFTLQFIIYIIISIILAFITQNHLVILVAIITTVQILTNQLQNIGIVEFIRYRQIMQIISYIIEMLLTICIYIFIPQNMIILLYVLLLKNIIYILAYFIKCKYIPNPLAVEKQFLKFVLRFGIFGMLTLLLIEFNYRLDVIILQQYVSYAEIGLYSVGSKLAQYVWLIPDAFKEVIFSHTAKKDSIDEIKTIIKINIVITLILIVIITIFGKMIIYILYGNEYIDAYVVTIVIFLGIPSMVLYKLINPLYMATGKQKKCFMILLCSVLANVILNYIYIPQYGKMGAAISTVVSYTVCGLIFYINFMKDYKVKWYECLIINKNDISKLTQIVKRKKGETGK